MDEKILFEEPAENGKSLVLVVEDDFELRTVVCAELEEEFEVLEAENGQDGLDQALEHVPDLVVSDIMMPVMDGIELCKELKERHATSHIPVIMLTAQSAVEHQIEGLESGADDYVTKPFLMELLVARIHNLLKSRRQLYHRFSEQLAEVEDPDDHETLDLPSLQNQGDRGFIEQTYTILRQRYTDADFAITSLAEELGMSRRSVQRKIKALTGRTPLQLITEYRLKQAAKLLRNTTTSITEVAYESGFGDLSHFYRLFKKQYDKNPSQYRGEE